MWITPKPDLVAEWLREHPRGYVQFNLIAGISADDIERENVHDILARFDTTGAFVSFTGVTYIETVTDEPSFGDGIRLPWER